MEIKFSTIKKFETQTFWGEVDFEKGIKNVDAFTCRMIRDLLLFRQNGLSAVDGKITKVYKDGPKTLQEYGFEDDFDPSEDYPFDEWRTYASMEEAFEDYKNGKTYFVIECTARFDLVDCIAIR